MCILFLQLYCLYFVLYDHTVAKYILQANVSYDEKITAILVDRL